MRGEIMAIVSLKETLGLNETRESQRIVILETRFGKIGIIVDEIYGVIKVREDDLEPYLSFNLHFFNLYIEYRYLNEEEFIKEWFDKFIIKTLYKYMPYTKLVECFDRYCSLRKNITKSYVSTYWRFCKNPKGFSSKISKSMKFFGLEELDEDRLKKPTEK